MAKANWTEFKVKLLKSLIDTHTHAQIGVLLGFSTVAVKSKARKLGFIKMKRFTAKDIAYVRTHYADTLTRKIADELKRSESAIYGLANRLKLEKSESFLKSNESGRLSKLTEAGRRFRFTKGQASPTKGKKQTEFMSANGIDRSKSTRFKKGNLPHNTLKDGTERTRYSKGRPYIWVRLAVGVWREKHRIVWAQHNGPIPKGYNVQFKDGIQRTVKLKTYI